MGHAVHTVDIPPDYRPPIHAPDMYRSGLLQHKAGERVHVDRASYGGSPRCPGALRAGQEQSPTDNQCLCGDASLERAEGGVDTGSSGHDTGQEIL